MPEEEPRTRKPPGADSGEEKPLTHKELLSILEERDRRASEPEEWTKLGDYIEERSHRGSLKALEEWQTKSESRKSQGSGGSRSQSQSQSKSQSGGGSGPTLLQKLLGQSPEE